MGLARRWAVRRRVVGASWQGDNGKPRGHRPAPTDEGGADLCEGRAPWLNALMGRIRIDVYLETNAINHLLRPANAKALERLLSGSELRPIVSAMGVAELVATANPTRRRKLLGLARDLTVEGKIVADRDDVIRATIAGFSTGDRRRVWRGITQRATKRLLFSADRVDDEDRSAALSGNREIDSALDQGAERLQRAELSPSDPREWVEGASNNPETARHFLRKLHVAEPPLEALAGAISSDEPYVRSLRAALLCTLGGAEMRRLPAPEEGGPVSGVDLTHGIYLACCEVFVSEDRDLQRLASVVADHLAHHPSVSRVGAITDL